VKELGVKPAMAEIQDEKGPFVWKDSYVYAADLEGKVLEHPGLVGKANRKDVLFRDPRRSEEGKGWVEYTWLEPDETAPYRKVTYAYRVPGQSIHVGRRYL